VAVFLIGYDLRKPGQDYTALTTAIKDYPGWWHHLDSTWFVVSSESAETIRNHLIQFIDSNDKLMVAKVRREAAWFGLTKEESDWIQSNFTD
jgi:hypothetical protein